MRLNSVVLLLLMILPACQEPDTAPRLSAGLGRENAEAGMGAILGQVRAATAKYHDVDAALADGFVPFSPCVSEPGEGGMGYHYAKIARVDGQVDPAAPEVLLYAPDDRGKLELVAVEFFEVVALWETLHDSPPSLGSVPFNGPMVHDGLPLHYDLHAWVWRENPAGTFAQFNPKVQCPAA